MDVCTALTPTCISCRFVNGDTPYVPSARGFASSDGKRDDNEKAESGKNAVDSKEATRSGNTTTDDETVSGLAEKKESHNEDVKTDNKTPFTLPLDGTVSSETDGVKNHRVVQNTWWEALTQTPVYAFRATTAKWVQAGAIKIAIDPSFDADEFSKQAARARDEVLKAYAGNDMTRVRAMCTPKVFDAFQASRIEYERNNLDLKYEGPSDAIGDDDDENDDENNSSQSSLLCTARLIDLRLARGETVGVNNGILDPEDDLVWKKRQKRCRAYVDEVVSSGKNDDSKGKQFDSMALDDDSETQELEMDTIRSDTAQVEDAFHPSKPSQPDPPLRLVATVFVMDKVGVKWVISDEVSGTSGTTEDLRVQEWSFVRDLPRFWPATESEPISSPWRVEHIG